MAAKPESSPAFQFYPAEFLADANVAMMDNRQLGCYIRLICFCWREGSIPSDLAKLAKLCNEDHEWLCHSWATLEPCFVIDDDTSKLIHPRLERERIKQKEFKNAKSNAGKRGATKRWGRDSKKWHSHASAIVLPMAKNSSSSSSSSSSLLEPPISPKGDDELPPGFAAFWRAWPRHPRKIGKPKCIAHWNRHGLERIADRVVAAVKRSIASPDWAKQDGEFIPMPLSWLNKSPWESDDTDTTPVQAAGDLDPCRPMTLEQLRRKLGVNP